MKSKKIKILFIIVVVFTIIFAVLHLSSREEVPEHVLQIHAEDETYLVDITKLDYEQVTGTRINGKGEEIPIEGQGILLKEILEQQNISGFSKVTILADDSYKVDITEEEINEDGKVYVLYEESSLRLVVFGDENSKRSVSNVVQIMVEYSADTYTFVDDLGRTVSVEEPQKVAALLGSYADMWLLAGGTIAASADDAWDDFALPLADDVVNLGKTKELSLEKLLALAPDFVLASTNTSQHLEWKETLENAEIPTAYFEVSDFEDYLRVLKICTDITGREDLYEKNGLSIQKNIEEVIEKSNGRIAEKGYPKVLYLRASATSIRAKNSQDNVLGEMLKALGCRNIADDEESLLENISVEYILQEDPDFIFFVQVGDNKEVIDTYIESFINDNPIWQELTAVKEGRVYHMDKMLYNLKPNDRWGEAYEKLEEILTDGQK